MPKAIVASHNHVEPGEEDEAYLPWFYKESPEFYDWLRQTYYIHQVSQVALLYLLGGWSFVVWGFVIRLLLGIHGSVLSWPWQCRSLCSKCGTLMQNYAAVSAAVR